MSEPQESPQKIYGKLLRNARKKAGLSQEQLAYDCGLETSSISRLERGIHQPTLDTLIKIAGVLGVSAGRMVSRVEGTLRDSNLPKP